jgi:CheY-like chemotaxis protein
MANGWKNKVFVTVRESMETKSTPPPITIVLVEDDHKTRKSLAELLKSESRVRCVGAYPDGETAVREIPQIKPEVGLIDINLPGMSGIECVQQLKKTPAEIPGVDADKIRRERFDFQFAPRRRQRLSAQKDAYRGINFRHRAGLRGRRSHDDANRAKSRGPF